MVAATSKITFNQAIAKKANYNFYFFQDSNFIPIVSTDNPSDQRHFYYAINENKVKIYGKNNIFPAGFVILNIPGEVEAINKGKLKEDNKIILSPNKLTPHLQLDWLNLVERDDFYTIVLPKSKNDNKMIGYIKSTHVPLLKNKDSEEKWFDLLRGESVLVLSEEEDFARIAVYTRKGMIDREIGASENIFTNKFVAGHGYTLFQVEYLVKPEEVEAFCKRVPRRGKKIVI
jgi:hypothetical protein